MAAALTLIEDLAGLAHPEGGWGYAPGQRPFLEPTCVALLALAGERTSPAVERGLRCLQTFRRADGSYRLDRGREEAVWGTALAMLTLVEFGHDLKSLEQSASFMLGVRGKPGQEDPDVDMAFDIDIKLIGWPWAEGTFSWVEPTSWACLALSQVGQGRHPRVEEGTHLLLNRAFDTGGANYGNKRVLGKMTDAIPGPSAIMLLALQHHRDEPRVVAARRYVRQHAIQTDDVEHLALARLALDAHGEDTDDIAARIGQAAEARRRLSWAEASPVRLAWAALGLNASQHNPLRTPAPKNTATLREARPTAVRTSLGHRLTSGVRKFLVRGIDRLRQPPAVSRVHVAKAESYDVDLIGVVRSQYEHFRDLVPLAGKRVVLKPNLVEWHRDKVINTDPRVIGAVIDLCLKEGAAEVIVAEGPGHWRNVEYLVAESGLGEVLSKYGVKFVDLNHDEPVKLPNLGLCTGLESLFMARTVAHADVLISMPKLKTHHWAGATLSLKNLFGTLPGICYGWPKNELHWRGIAESIIDIALTRTPELAVVDGVVGMEGDGPLNGSPRPVGALVMGNDLVAVDATGCRLMGLPAEQICHVALGAHKRLGRMSGFELLGEPVADLAQSFERPPRWEKIILPAVNG